MNAPVQSSPSTPDPAPRVLVAEDSATQAATLEAQLRAGGCDVRVVGNGRAGLVEARAWRPALIISDVMMPEMDGYSFCREVKRDAGLRRIPVMLLTSLSDPDDVIHGLECGADSFLVKPYEESELLGRVAQLLAGGAGPAAADAADGVGIDFRGKRYHITAGRRQILSLLLSTYETAVNQNRRLLEAQRDLREANERLGEANQELEAFGYTVSHDLRAPLRAMGGFSRILEEELEGKLTEAAGRHLGRIREGAERMGRLIDDLLAFSRSSRQPLRRSEVDLGAVCRDVLRDLGADGPSDERVIAVGPLPRVSADPALIRQVLFNLLSNALKYSHRRRPAEIAVGVQDPAAAEPVIFVRDNGAGFDMRYAAKLFGVFQRLHGASEFDGSGVGLAIVHRILKRHGGQIWAEAEVDRGACFFFTVPPGDPSPVAPA